MVKQDKPISLNLYFYGPAETSDRGRRISVRLRGVESELSSALRGVPLSD